MKLVARVRAWGARIAAPRQALLFVALGLAISLLVLALEELTP